MISFKQPHKNQLRVLARLGRKTGTGIKMAAQITPADMSRHCSKDDVWIVIDGKVGGNKVSRDNTNT